MKLLFLDVDGVLNHHGFVTGAQSCNIVPECVGRLNRIIAETDCKIAISSAWRYMIHGGAMTLRGFEYMLRTHGCHVVERIVGITEEDGDKDGPERWTQICRFRDSCAVLHSWCVLDDEPMCFEEGADWNKIVLTNGKLGLQDADAEKVIAMLNRRQP